VDALAGIADQAVTGAVTQAMPAVPGLGDVPLLNDLAPPYTSLQELLSLTLTSMPDHPSHRVGEERALPPQDALARVEL
jgi:hypothetical protein